MNRKSENSAGFSMLELVIVMAIILCIAAIAFPKIQGAMESVRLRSTITDIDGLVQQLRIQSVRANRSFSIRTANANAGNGVTLYIDGPSAGFPNGNGAFDAGE